MDNFTWQTTKDTPELHLQCEYHNNDYKEDNDDNDNILQQHFIFLQSFNNNLPPK